MKLWKKLSLICSAILILMVSICAFFLLGQAQEKILSLKYEQSADKLTALTRSFAEMVNHYYSPEDSDAVNHALMHYCFSHFADSSAVLQLGDEIVYSLTELRPGDYLTLERRDSLRQFTGKLNGRQILIMGSTVDLFSSEEKICAVYLVEDITAVYDSMIRLFWQFALMAVACIAAGLLLITLLVRRSLAPLGQLQAAASSIAAGNYHERAPIGSRDEVGALAADFNRMADAIGERIRELTEKAERQQRFIGGVTHEFKTPLTALLLHTDLLQNTYMEEEERLSSLAHMEKQCRWLERLVQKLLKLITLDQALDIQPASVPDLFRHVQDTAAERFRSRGVTLKMECHVDSLPMDFDLMQSALVNLADNACRASASGQSVLLCAYGNVLEVKDSGIGIPRESLDRVTEPFYMVDKSRSKKNSGVGLGLALVKEIADAHGAKLEIESVPGTGTTVRLRLK